MIATKAAEKPSKSQLIPLGFAALLLIFAIVMPGFGALNRDMVKVIFLIFFAVVLWVTKPIPILASSLLVMALQPLLGLVPSLAAALSGFTSPANYFVIASFGFAFALQKTTLSNRLLKQLVAWSRGSTRLITLSLMAVTYIVSMFISDIAAAVIMLAFAMDFSALIEDEKERANVLKLMMIGIPIGSILGGTATPVGSSINVMALNLMQQHSGTVVPFMKWVALCLPVSAVALIFAWFIMTRFFKTAKLPESKASQYTQILQKSIDSLKSNNEPLIIGILLITIFIWIISSWIKALDATIVSIITLALLFLPGVNAFSWTEFKNKMSWEIPIMGASTISLGNLAVNKGLIELIVNSVTETFRGIGMAGLVAIVGTLVTVLLIAIPVGPTMVSMLTIPSFLMAQALGLNSVAIVIVVGMFASNSSILPLNAVMLLSYSKGAWKTSDLIPIGIILSVVWIILSAIWIPIATALVF